MSVLTPDQYPGLPKWPAAFVTGKSVTPEQANDIIFRTDTSLHSPSEYGFGNDKRFAEHCVKVFGWQPLIDAENAWYKIHTMPEAQKAAEMERLLPEKYGYDNLFSVRDAWRDELGIISTEYVCNSWLASSYIGGPHGWCSPQGNIHSDGHNYGKWPSVEAIVDEWTKLMAAFPYLHLACTLYSGEQCEEHSVPVCTILVAHGAVNVYEPTLELHDRNPTMGNGLDDSIGRLMRVVRGDYSGEHGWPAGWVEEFGAKSTAAMKKVAPWL